jgi:CheY-like chemotaxis protein
MKSIEVMLVEDDTGEALLIGEILAKASQPVKLRIARDGMEALLMLSNDNVQPDLIIVDLKIPLISGHGVIELFHPRAVPVVAFSSSMNPDDRQRALTAGAREFVQKPTDLTAYTNAVLGIVEKWVVKRQDSSASAG